MDGPRGHYAKLNESDKYKYHTISPICGMQTNNNKKPKLLDTVNRLAVARGRSRGMGEMGEGDKSLKERFKN